MSVQRYWRSAADARGSVATDAFGRLRARVGRRAVTPRLALKLSLADLVSRMEGDAHDSRPFEDSDLVVVVPDEAPRVTDRGGVVLEPAVFHVPHVVEVVDQGKLVFGHGPNLPVELRKRFITRSAGRP